MIEFQSAKIFALLFFIVNPRNSQNNELSTAKNFALLR